MTWSSDLVTNMDHPLLDASSTNVINFLSIWLSLRGEMYYLLSVYVSVTKTKTSRVSFENCWNSSEGLILKWWNPATTANVTFNCKSLEFVGVSNILSYERTRLLGCKGVFYLGEGKNILIGYLTLSHNMRRKVSSFSSSSFISNIPFFVRISYSDCGLVKVSGSGGRGEGAWNWRSS